MKDRLILRKTEDVYETVRKTFIGDNAYLQKFHVESPCGLYEAVKYSVNHILVYTPNRSDFYKIVERKGGAVVGYVCTFDNEIWDFAIRKEYRENKDAIWDLVTKGAKEYVVRLYQDNERDISWLVDKGCRPVYHYMPTSEILLKYMAR
jgi:hypothetical protein